MRPRSGFTLLEVIVALAIGLLLVAVLYVAMDFQFRSMQNGRKVVEEGQVARGLLRRVAADIRQSLALPQTLATLQTKFTNSASSSSSGSSSSSASTLPPGQFSAGVVGSDSQIILFQTDVPHFSQTDAQNQVNVSDVRQLSYGFQAGVGLVRHHYRAPPAASVSDGMSFTGSMDEIGSPEVLAPEVVSLQFRYFDMTSGSWVTSWDGSSMGPPQAVEITVLIQQSVLTMTRGARPRPPTAYRSVVAVPTAAVPQAMIDQQAGVTP
jgi:prepilin-type N-terminal cleavage/methylation domain-containing protein